MPGSSSGTGGNGLNYRYFTTCWGGLTLVGVVFPIHIDVLIGANEYAAAVRIDARGHKMRYEPGGGEGAYVFLVCKHGDVVKFVKGLDRTGSGDSVMQV